ncbi:MAG: hypothetical protein ABI658_26960 [Acidimicrobiales bacterium]
MVPTSVPAVAAETVSLHCGSKARTPNGIVLEVVALICDVGTQQITHIAVGMPGSVPRIVQVSCVTAGPDGWLEIELVREEIEQLAPFAAPYEKPAAADWPEQARTGLWLAPRDNALIRSDGVPDAPLALRSPVPVRRLSQRYVGHIVLWNLERRSGRINSIIVREGQRFNHTDSVVAGSHIEHIDDDGVQLVPSTFQQRRARLPQLSWRCETNL